MIIRAANLTRRFGVLTAVDHLNLDIAAGEIFGLVGPDGAGKTTTLRLLCGLMDATEGSATVAGHDVAREPDKVTDQIGRSEEHTSELQSRGHLVCRLLLEK